MRIITTPAAFLRIHILICCRRRGTTGTGGRVAMDAAIVATLAGGNIISFQWILVGLVIGSLLGALVAVKAAMTQMPEMIALLYSGRHVHHESSPL